MSNVSVSQTLHTEQASNVATGKNQGTLKTDKGEEHSVVMMEGSEEITEPVSRFLQEANQRKADPEALNAEFFPITPEVIEVESEIQQLEQELAQMQKPSQQQNTSRAEAKPQNQIEKNAPNESKPALQSKGESAPQSQKGVVYSSIFSLARSVYTTIKESRSKDSLRQDKSSERGKETHALGQSSSIGRGEQIQTQESRYDREGEGKQGGQQDQEEKERKEREEKKKKKIAGIGGVQASRGKGISSPRASTGSTNHSHPSRGSVGGVESIYIRFMALMARILGQAEAEAHELYLRIKDRTDAIDVLTLLISKINSEKGAIDWTKNEEMKALIEKARNLGVDIPAGKCKWTEDEKKLLKENIQMRKDSMEKMTQLERTDMQRFLQEASQCHQARSNVLKLLKEVMDSIIANMRP